MSETKMVEKEGIDGKPVKIIGPSYEAGGHEMGDICNWKSNMTERDKYMKYLMESERYWYMDSNKWFGSEKRKNPA